MNLYRVVFSTTPTPDDPNPNGLELVEASSEGEAMAIVGLRHHTVAIISCTLQGAAPPNVEEQRDGLLRALRPLFTVCRALLDNQARELFTEPMRRGLEVMCADAVRAMVAAGLKPPSPSADRCSCCGSRTELHHFVLTDLRIWTSCAACVAHCDRCKKQLAGAVLVPA